VGKVRGQDAVGMRGEEEWSLPQPTRIKYCHEGKWTLISPS
jgi:hypothetical protein